MIGTIEATKPQHCGACPFFAYRRIPSTAEKSPILLLGEYPSITSPQGGKPFQDREGAIVNMALRHLQKSYYESEDGVNRWKKLTPARAYAVQCITDDKPPKLAVSRCRAFLLATLDQVEPRLIVTFGASTLQHLTKHKHTFDSVRGTFLPFKRLDEQRVQDYTLFATYTPKAVLAKPGLFDELLRDLRKAFLFAEQRGDFERLTEEQLRAGYIFPHTVDAVREVCQLIIDYHHAGQPSEKHLIAFDTETSTLEMHDKEAKIIAVSFSWDTGKSTTIVLDHPDAWWTPAELTVVKQHVQRVLACKKPKVAHNAKFDWKGIFHRYGWHIENLVWDTMCGEHLLEEDKRGEYGLKSLTRTRLPRYAGYDDRIAEIRDQHGGLTRAQAAKKFRKDSAKYDIAMHDYATKADIFDTAFAEYKKEMEAWTAKRDEEKKIAKAEKRAMDKGVTGRKPRKPPKPRPPKKPERQEVFDFTMIPLPELELYAAVDPDVTRQHVLHQNNRFNTEYDADVEARERYNRLHKKVKWDIPPRTKQLMGRHVIPLTRTLSAMEFTGFPVDLPYLEELDQKLQVVVEATEKRLYELAGRFVANNPRDVVNVLFQTGFYDEKAGTRVTVPVDENTRRTAKLQIKADEKALLYVANTYGYEFPKQLIQYRKAQKARSPFLINVREQAIFDGRMHPQFHIAGTGTGRTSSSDENMQNIPKKLAGFNIKKIFIPPPGMVLMNTDAKGAEVRIFATYARDERLIQAILDGMDSHSFFTSKVYPEYTYEAVERARKVVDIWTAASKNKSEPFYLDEIITRAMFDTAELLVKKRTSCKRVVFGILYGAMAKKISETAGIPVEEAQKIIDLMFDLFPSIPAYIKQTEQEIMLFHGAYTKTGRKRRFPMVEMNAFRNRCFRQGVNFKIQSTSSDIVLWVLNQIFPVITHDLHGEFHATVHDSIVFSVPPQYVAQVKPLMYEYGTRRAQEAFPWLLVPFLWDVEAGPSYGETSDVEEYLKGQKQHDTEAEEDLFTDEEFKEELNEQLAVN